MSGVAVWTDLEILEMVFRHRTLRQSALQVGLTFGVSRNVVIGIAKRVSDGGALVHARRWRDSDMLAIANRVLVQGHPCANLANRFDLTRNAVLYLVWLVMNDAACAWADEVLRPVNDDAVKWPIWWQPVVARPASVSGGVAA